MKVQEDHYGEVLTGQREAQTSLHGGDERHIRPTGEHPLDQSEVGEVVFDVEHLAGRRAVRSRRRSIRRTVEPFEPYYGSLDKREVECERRSFAEHAVEGEG